MTFTSDEERREIAENLRREILYTRGSLGDWWMRLHEAVTGSEDFPCPQETIAAIADLIDRGECENVYDENEMGACDNGFECSVCGCRVEDEEHYHVSGTWNWCPQCGKRVWPKKK